MADPPLPDHNVNYLHPFMTELNSTPDHPDLLAICFLMKSKSLSIKRLASLNLWLFINLQQLCDGSHKIKILLTDLCSLQRIVTR